MGVASSILLNGRFTDPFPIPRSIRQGCPLSALLFVVVMDILSNLISSWIANGNLHGARLSDWARYLCR